MTNLIEFNKQASFLINKINALYQENDSFDNKLEAIKWKMDTAYIANDINKFLIIANNYYYQEGKSLITDNEYDKIYELLNLILKSNPAIKKEIKNLVTENIIGQDEKVSSGFKKWKHKVPLLSMMNTYNTDDILAFHQSLNRLFPTKKSNELLYVIEPKYDGLSIAITYENGILKEAITRWNGEEGDIVTENIKQIKSIPLKINTEIKNLIVRGEVLLPKSNLDKINLLRIEEWKQPFSNTRNCASGTLKLLDPAEVWRRGLTCIIYDILYADGKSFSEQIQETKYLRQLWFKTAYDVHWFCELVNKELYDVHWISEFVKNEKLLPNLLKEDIDFDGLVIKNNDKKIQAEAWYTWHHPRFAFAYKFPSQQVSTQLLGIEYSIGRTWTITPVWLLEPVVIWNVTVSRVSLHNFALCREKNIKVGDYLFIQRSGEVIPYVLGVDHSKPNTSNHPPIDSIDKCPFCNSDIIKWDIFYTCPNENCGGKINWMIKYFCSKEALDINGIGESVAEMLVSLNLVKSFDELFTLKNPEKKIILLKQEGFGEKKYEQIIKGVEEAKTRPLERKLSSLGIAGLWKTVSKLIVKNLGSIDLNNGIEIFDRIVKDDFLISIDGIWPEISNQIKKWWNNVENKHLILRLEKNWFTMKYNGSLILWNIKNIEAKNDNSLYQIWEHFSLTWTLPFSRNTIVERLEKVWLIFDESPKKTTHYLLVWEKAWSKLEKAQKMGINCLIGWEECKRVFKELEDLK